MKKNRSGLTRSARLVTQEDLDVRVAEYLSGPEQLSPRELEWGVVRDAPAPFYEHQTVVGRTYVLLEAYVRAHDLGTVCLSPIDVVLDVTRGLVVQPDVSFVSKARVGIIRGQIWGPPDLVVEVASRRTARRDRTTKVSWYRTYRVRECWLVHPDRRDVVIVDLTREGRHAVGRFKETDTLRSAVLPGIGIQAGELFPRPLVFASRGHGPGV